MIPVTKALPRDQVFQVAIDIDLVALDTLTPWLDHYGMKLSDVGNSPEKMWHDIAAVIQEKAAPSDIYPRPYDFWCDGSIYTDAQPTEGFREFLEQLSTHIESKTGKHARFFFCSTCVSSHKPEKMHRVHELYQDIVQGFVDTSCKHLVDFDLLIDDSPNQCMSAAIAGKRVMLSPSPANNIQLFVHNLTINNVLGNASVARLFPSDKAAFGYGEWYKEFLNRSEEERAKVMDNIIGIGDK